VGVKKPITVQHMTHRGMKTYRVYGNRVAVVHVHKSGKVCEMDLTSNSEAKAAILARARRKA
jgi:hypothetical protein